MKSTYKISIIIGVLMVLQTSCKKLVQVDAPVTSTNASNVYSTDATAASVLTGIYTNLSLSIFSQGGLTSMSLFGGLSADELRLYPGSPSVSIAAYFTNGLTNSNTMGTDFWNKIYPVIFYCNSALEGLNGSASLTPTVKQELTGEAKFVRAFCYFYLVNLYGDVPLALSSDSKVNAVLARTAKAQVYQQIVSDLKDAQSLLSQQYVGSDAISPKMERTRPTQWAATALLARVYLYTGDWVDAEAQASTVIGNTSLFSLAKLNSVFLKNSTEAIWQLQPVLTTPSNTQDGAMFILPTAGPNITSNPVFLSNNLLDSFEANDLRRANWVDSVTVGATTYFYSYKYKNPGTSSGVTEYTMVFRLAEQYLIRAEARVKQNNLTGAIEDLDQVRNRAGLPLVSVTNPGITQSPLLDAILHERQVELFTEWGHRWLDLKRTGKADAVMSVATPQKGGVWNSNWQLYPISLTELQKDPNLVQNASY